MWRVRLATTLVGRSSLILEPVSQGFVSPEFQQWILYRRLPSTTAATVMLKRPYIHWHAV